MLASVRLDPTSPLLSEKEPQRCLFFGLHATSVKTMAASRKAVVEASNLKSPTVTVLLKFNFFERQAAAVLLKQILGFLEEMLVSTVGRRFN